MATSKIVSLDLLSYLQTLPPALLSRLYQHPPPCLAVYRTLPDLAQLYIMRLLFLDKPLPLSDITSWALPGTTGHHDSLTLLERLHILESSPLLSGQQQGVVICSAYQSNMKVLMCGGGHYGEDKHSRDIEYLNNYADKRWESILNFMVGSSLHSEIDSEISTILQHARLMSVATPRQPSFITTLGFQFLLMDTKSQVWYFILQYLNTAQERGLDLIDCLNFIFQLSFSVLGKDYSTKGLTPTQTMFMQHLCQFGLVYQRRSHSKRYYPTKLVVEMTSGKASHMISHVTTKTTGFIIIETNYRVIAYTDSKLHIATLGLFCQMQYRFPNMVVGTITRESVHQALMHGITADQILSFLIQHAHPDMLGKKNIIPPTVSDQIRLWEIERDRLQFQEGILYSDFLSMTDFEKVKKYAEDLGVLLWSNSTRRLMVIDPSRHDEIRHFWKRQKQHS